jgi:hypothetical protein
MYRISDSATHFCSRALSSLSGRWDPAAQAWTFHSLDDATEALFILYRATRASSAQRDTLASLIEEGLAAQAWDFDLDRIDLASWLASLSRERASHLIGEAIRAAKVLCHRPLEDRPPQIHDDCFDISAFERGVEARRARLQRSWEVR